MERQQGTAVYHRCVPTDDEIEQRQLPPKLDTRGDETCEGQRRGGHHLRTDAGGRNDVLRLAGGERPGDLQAAVARHHRKPLRRLPGRCEGEGVYEGFVPERLRSNIKYQILNINGE